MNENEQYLRDLHKHLKVNENYEGWYSNVSGNEDYLRGLHGHLGVKDDYNTWYSSVWGVDVKKKDEPEVPSALESVSEEGSVESTSSQAPQTPSGDSGSLPTRERVTASGGKYQEVFTEKPFIEGELGEYIRKVPWIGNDLDDWARSYSEGASKRGQAAPAMDLLFPALSEMLGKDFEKEDYRDAAEALAGEVNRYNDHVKQYGTSEELHSWNKSIQENGNGVAGLTKTIWEHKGDLRNILGQWAIQSLSTAMSDEALEKAAAVQGGGMLAGAPAGPAGVAAAGVATLPFSMATLSGVTAASQFLVEELQKEVGEDFNADAILDALENDEFRGDLRKNAAIYGVGVGTVDAATMKMGGGLAAQQMRTTSKFFPKTKLAAQVAAGEGAGGAIGEGVASTAAGRDVTAEEMFQEFASGAFNTPVTLTYGAIKEGGMRMAENPNTAIINQLNVRSKYEINGQKLNKEDFISITEKMTPEELSGANIKIEEDPETTKMLADRFEAMPKKPETSLKDDVSEAMTSLDNEIQSAQEEVESLTDAAGTEAGLDVDQKKVDEAKTKLNELKDKKTQAQRLIGETGQSKKDVVDSKAAASTPLVDTQQLEADAEVAAQKEQELRSVLGLEQKPEEAPVEPTSEGPVTDRPDAIPLPDPKPKGKVANFWETFRQKVDDKFLPLMRLQQSAEKRRQQRLADKTNIDQALSLFDSRVAARIKKATNSAEEMGKVIGKSDLQKESLDQYLYARHAPERNRVMTERYQNRIQEIKDKAAETKRELAPKEKKEVEKLESYIEEGRGSGITDQQAQEIMDGFSESEKKSLQRAAVIHDELIQNTRNTIRESGLQSDETVDLYEDQYEFYTPLKGFQELDPNKVLSQDYAKSSGVDVRSSGIDFAEGRVTEAADMSATAVNQNARIHMLAEKNKVANTVLDFVKENPNEKVYKVVDQKAFDKLGSTEKDRAVGVMKNGENQYIVFAEKHEKSAEMLKNMSPQKMTGFMKFMSAFARLRSKSFTQLDPSFFSVNFARDIQGAFATLVDEHGLGTKEGREMVANTIKDSPKNLKAMLSSMTEKGKERLAQKDPEYARMLEEFEMDGGKTGWGYAPSIEDLAKKLDEAATEKEAGKISAAWMAKNGLKMLESMSDAFENSIRFSTYVNARKMGESRARAAYLSKEVTVNFNRSGEWGSALSATYMFFNAQVQGSKKVLKTMTGKRGRRVGAGMALVGAMITEYNRAVSEEEEDGVLSYDKISPYERSRNIIIMRPDGKRHITIPLGYGFGLFHNVGEQFSSIAHGGRDGKEASFEMIDAAMNAFSPVSFGASKDPVISIAKTVMPSNFMPVFEAAVNENWKANKISYTYEGKAKSEQSFRSPAFVQEFFKGLNNMTGGTKFTPGTIDVNPDRIVSVIEGYTGGIGKTVGQTMATTTKVLGQIGSESKFQIDPSEVPIISKFYSSDKAYYDYFTFRDNADLIRARRKEMKDPDLKKRFKGTTRFSGIGDNSSLYKRLLSAEKALKRIKNQKEKAEEIKDMGERLNKFEELEKQEAKYMRTFNKTFNEWKKRTKQD